MLLVVQLVLFCVLFTAVVAAVVKDGPLGGLFFYPKPVQERALELGWSRGTCSSAGATASCARSTW